MNSGSKAQEHNNVRRIVFDVNGSCNSDCMFCTAGGSHPELDVSTEKVIQRIDAFGLESGSTIVLSGGEPTGYEGICDIISYLRDKNINVMMITNGRKFCDPEFSKKIIDSGVGEIITEIHSVYPEVHDFLTQRSGSFRETTTGIKNILDLKACVKVKIILNRVNYRTAPEIVSFICQNFQKTSTILITALNIDGSAITNRGLLGVRFCDSSPYAEKCIDIAKMHKMPIKLDLIPICTLKPEYRRYSIPRAPHGVYLAGKYKAPKKHLARECDACNCKIECPGVSRSHILEFGGSEVKPITSVS